MKYGNKMQIYSVPEKFQPACSPYEHYPKHNKDKFDLVEHAAHRYFSNALDIKNFMYLPIYWTAYHVSTGYGKSVNELKNFVENIKTDKRLFTTVQYDDGTLVDSSLLKKNCVVFGAGGIGGIPIPLLSSPHSATMVENPKWFASFCGSKATHPLREELVQEFSFKSDVEIGNGNVKYFEDTISNSVFTLCPRGYGKTSFRLYEAIQLGSIPVYIYDDLWLPFTEFLHWQDFCILCHRSEIKGLYNRLKEVNRFELRKELKKVQYLFTMEYTLQYIFQRISALA
jgi:hypothetical protein